MAHPSQPDRSAASHGPGPHPHALRRALSAGAHLMARIDDRLADRATLVLVALFLLGALHGWFAHARLRGDFEVFYKAAGDFLKGDTLYHASDGINPFKYAPSAVLLFVPLRFLPYWAATLVMNLLSVGAFVRFVLWASRQQSGKPLPVDHLIVFVLLMPFSLHIFDLAQVDALLVWLIAESEIQSKERPWLSGALWAIAAIFKVHFLALLLFAVAFRQWRRIASLAVFFAVGLALPILYYGFDRNLAILRDWQWILAATTPARLCSYDNQSLFSMVCVYIAPPESAAYYPWIAVLATAVVVGGGWIVIRVLRRRPELGRAIGFSFVFYLAALFSPLGWRTNLVAAAPLLYLLVGLARRADHARVRTFAWVATGSLFFVQRLNYEVMGWEGYRWLLQQQHYGLSMLAAVFGALVAICWETSASRRAPPSQGLTPAGLDRGREAEARSSPLP